MGLTFVLLLLPPHPTSALILLSIMSAYVPLLLPAPTMLAWVVVLLIINTGYFVGLYGWGGLLSALSNASGLVAYAVVGGALRQAHLAHQQARAAQAQLQQMAVVEERNRMAREMHDSLGHRLTVAVVQLEGAQRLIPIDSERAARMIGVMREEMKEALAELRHTVSALRAPAVDERPLEAALAELAQTFERQTGLTTHFMAAPACPPLPEPYRLAFYRVAQEALTNVQRHARATQVWVTLEVSEQAIVLRVEDNGRGYAGEPAGNGLTGLHERAAQLGGQAVIDNGTAGGARIVFSAPRPGL